MAAIDLNQQNFPLQKIIPFNQQYISSDIFKSITKGCTFPPIAIEEIDSDLWCYSYDGYGKVFFKDGSIYTGGAKFGILTNEIDKTRPCTINFSNGTFYKGEINNNILNGHGEIKFPSGSTYVGEIKNGLRHGFGVYKDVNGLIYEGEFCNGYKEGKGKLVKNNIKYEGTFHNGHIHGYGRLTWNNGDQYEGEFENDKINGVGTMYWATLGEKYTGQWKNNKENGFGIYIWYENTINSKTLRNRYIGYWINGVREGYGVFFYSNDTKYEGFWEHNAKNGFGVFRFKNGTEYIGDFLQDRMINYLTEGIVKLNKGDGNYFDYDDELDDKTKKKIFNNVSSHTTIDKKNSKSSLLPIINGSKSNESITNNSKLEVIMENENSKAGNETNVNFKAKKHLITKNSAINKKEEKILSHLKTEKNDLNNLSPRKLNTILNEKNNNNNKITDIRIMKDQKYLASNRMINEIGNNQFLSIIDLSDIFEFEDHYEQTQTEVSNCILRNISEFTRVYNRLLKAGPGDDDTLLPKTASMRFNEAFDDINESVIHPQNDLILQKTDNNVRYNLNLVKKDNSDNKNNNVLETPDKNKNIKKNNSLIESVPLNPTFADDKIGTCLELKDIWKFFRDYGIVGEDLTIADFDRIFYRGKKNAEEMFLIPEELPRRKIYKFLELMVRKSEEKFKSVHQKYRKFTEKEKNLYDKNISRKSLVNINGLQRRETKKSIESILKQNNNNDVSLYCEENEENSELITFDFHNHHNPVLLRQFYEALIRAAYSKYYNTDMKLYQKIELLTSRFSGKSRNADKSSGEKSKTKKLSKLQTKSLANSLNNTLNDLSTSNLGMPILGMDGNIILSMDQQRKNAEHVKIDAFIVKYAANIKPLFVKLYYVENELNNFHKENKKINDQTLNHRFVFNNVVKKSKLISQFFGKREQYCGFITYYFREKHMTFKTKIEQFKYYESLFDLDMVFFEFCEFIYLVCSKYITSNKLNIDDEQNYNDVIHHLEQLIRGNESFRNKTIIKKAKFNYCFPVLRSHIEKKLREDEKIKMNQIGLIKRVEKLRVEQERKNLQLNDENMCKEEEEVEDQANTQEEEENSDYY